MTKKLYVSDEGLITWLWNNADLVGKIEKILKQKKSQEETIKKIKELLKESN
jgi:hypothetical protein